MSHPVIDPKRRLLLKSTLGLAAAALSPSLLAAPPAPEARTLSLLNLHTGEHLAATYWERGSYLPDALEAISHVLRDHRADEAAAMDTGLLDLLHRLHANLDSGKAFHVISGYRSPGTNARLRQKSNGVAKRSLHMQGKAIDIRLPGLDTSRLYQAARALNGGGVGLYSQSGFIHLDVGRVRTWGA